MKFPKEIGGWAPDGNTDARFIDQYGQPYLTRRRPGYVATTRQGELEVTRDDTVKESSFYTSSLYLSGIPSPAYFSSSRTAVGLFGVHVAGIIDLGTEPGTSLASLEFAFNFGRGYAAFTYVTATDDDPWHYNPYPVSIPGLGSPVVKYALNLVVTREGRTLTKAADMPVRFDYGGFQPFVQSLGTAIVGSAVAPVSQTEWCGLTREDGGQRARMVYVRRFKDGSIETSYMEPSSDRTKLRPFVVRPSPNMRLALRGWLLEGPDNYTPDLSDPCSSWCVSLDAGKTWTDLAVSAYDDQYAAWQARVIEIMTEPGVVPSVDSVLVEGFVNNNVKCAQMNATQALIFFCCPKYYPTYGLTGTPNNELLAMGDTIMSAVVDLASGSFSNVQTVWESINDMGYATSPGGAAGALGLTESPGRVIYDVLSLPDGVLVNVLFNPRKSDFSKNFEGARTTQFTNDGTTYTNVHTMPFAGGLTGRITAKDSQTLMCPMWTGDLYGLLTTKDKGASWVIDANTLPGFADSGVPTGYQLTRFNTMVKIRTGDGKAAPFNPIAPWDHDVRVSHP